MPDVLASVNRLGVVGAGTMGAGIAETAIAAGVPTVLIDALPEALTRAQEAIDGALRRAVERERLTAQEADAARARLTLGAGAGDLASCDAVVEAVSERLELKRQVFGDVAEACGPGTLLATNTSSLLVSAVARGVPHPERIVGMHFFNPVARMRLVEVVPGAATAPATVAATRALGERLGKHVVVARDGIGFLVNRCGRPFVGEALRILQEGLATAEQIDRICRMGGGFRMGPLELVDLIGVDVNLEIAESFWRQSYGEPRWRPSSLQAGLVAAGRHGRKTGIGFHDYREGAHREADPEPPPVARGAGEAGLVVVAGRGPVADGLRSRARAAGFEVRDPSVAGAGRARLFVDADPTGGAAAGGAAAGATGGGAPRAVLCAGRSLHAVGDDRACGFHLIGPLDAARLVETTALPRTDPQAVAATESFFAALGLHVERVGDAPGLVLGRIVAQLVNEAAFALGEGVGTPADIDAGMTLGLNHPRGPIAWSAAAGLEHVRAILRALVAERHEERYRMAPLLARAEDLAAGA